MKKIILMAFLLISSISAFSQTKLNLNVNAGIGMSNYYGKNTDGTDAKLAYKVGLGMELPFNNTWSLQTGLNFVSKGCKAGDSELKGTINQLYLELPVMAGLRMETANNFDVLLKAGPYFAYGVGGKTKVAGVSMDTFNDNDGLKKFDCGLGIGAGFEFGQVVVGLDGNFGLTPLFDGGDEVKAKNISAFLTLGYKF